MLCCRALLTTYGAGYAAFAGATFGVLCAMDVLECFLHALRLHWYVFACASACMSRAPHLMLRVQGGVPK